MKSFFFALLCLLICPFAARAQPVRSTFALIVTNNFSSELGRPELRYADDDGVKYAEVFRMIAVEDHVQLLTELDADSARLFPNIASRAPSKAAVQAATQQLAAAVAHAKQQGQEVDFYFVFAGHGDVDRGQGFLELRDARLTSEDLEQLLHQVNATRAHVILDSCNSFFVLNARKPGGTRMSVSAEAAQSLSQRLPHVGVFLSTSAEAEVFEWSELQAGIFSHAVRSGLLGGADANADGQVSYDELRAFVDIAASGVKNPLYRPQVFARGPDGSGAAPIFPVGHASGVRVSLDPAREQRVTVRDREGLPWIDVHKEAGAPLTVAMPAASASEASLEERDADGRISARQTLEPTSDTPLAQLTPATTGTARGLGDSLRALFSAPFGPRALAAYQASLQTAAPPVYGVSRDDIARMDTLLAHAASVDRSQRTMVNALRIGMGALFMGCGITALVRGPGNETDRAVGYILAAGGALDVGIGIWGLGFHTSEGEKLYASFRSGLTDPTKPAARVAAESEERLFALSEAHRKDRRRSAGSGFVLVALGTGAIIANELVHYRNEDDRSMYRLLLLAPTGIALAYSTYLLFPGPMERIADLWRRDPGLSQLPRVSVAPVANQQRLSGAVLSLSGRF